MLAQAPVILIVHPDVPAKTLAELLALAKKTTSPLPRARRVLDSPHGVMVNSRPAPAITHVPFKVVGPGADRPAGRGPVSMQYGGSLGAALHEGRQGAGHRHHRRESATPPCPTCHLQKAGWKPSTSRACFMGLHARRVRRSKIRRAVRDAVAAVSA